MIKRDTVAKKYYVSINNGTVYEYSYTYNPTGGSNSKLAVAGMPGEAQSDGDYFDVMVFNRMLSTDEITIMYSTGMSKSTWFNYTAWDSTTGSGHVSWVYTNMQCTEFTLSVDNGYEQLIDNLGVVEPAFSSPKTSCSFIVRHDSNTFLDWQDNATEIYVKLTIDSDIIYLTKALSKVDVTDDELTMQKITLLLGKNGADGNYVNTSVSDHRPVVLEV